MNKGEEVICIDDFSTGSIENISHWIKNKNFKLIDHDITEPFFYKSDRIWNFACPASPIKYQKDPIKTAQINFIGTYNVLELAKKTGSKVLMASTSEIYGDPKVSPQSESYLGSVNTIGIRSCYDEGKRIAETLCYDYERIHKLDIRLVRIFNTYGPRMLENDGRVISNFIPQAIRGKPLTIYGKGSQTRSFCYIEDLIEGLILLMDSQYTKPINLGNPEELNIKELGEIICKMLGKVSNFEFSKLPQDDPLQRKPDISLAYKELKWSPKTSLKSGLEKTIHYFSKRISNEN